MKKISLHIRVLLYLLPLISQPKVSAQALFDYQHWSDGLFTGSIIKSANAGGGTPLVIFRHTRLGVTHVSSWIDYRSDDGSKYRAFIGYRVIGDMVNFYFTHYPESNLGAGREDVILNFRDPCTSRFQIRIPPCSLSEFQSINEPIKIVYTVLGRGNNCPAGITPPPLPQADESICPDVKIQPGWVIISQEYCVGSCNDRAGTGCIIRVIRDLRNRPKGYTVNICPGQQLPSGWSVIGTAVCNCDPRGGGSSCLMQTIRKN